MPVRTQISSVVPVASFPAERTALHNPTIMTVDNATETFAHAPRPDPRDSDELTEAAREVPRFCDGVATTLTAYDMRNRLVQKCLEVV